MKNKEEWLDQMELRLKRGFLDVAELNEEEGRRFLAQEVSSHLEEVVGEATRKEYLLSLRDRFPLLLNQSSKLTEQSIQDMLQRVEGQDLQTDLAERTEPTERTERTESALEIVRREWCNLSDDERENFLKEHSSVETRAEESEPSAPLREQTSEEPSAEFARFLKLAMEAELSTERIQEIFISLLKTVSQVDALGTQVYKQLQLSQDVRQKDLRKMVGDYVTGTTMDAAQLHELLDQSRIKVGLIITTIANLPETLSQTHLAKFQPTLIEQMVGNGSLLRGKESQCWQKYVTLADDLQPQKLEKAINDLLIAQLKKLKRSQ